MESSKFLCKIDSNILESKNNSNGIYFTKPYLVAYYELNYNAVEPAKKIFYYKKPRAQNYPIDLNLGYHTYIERLASVTSLKGCLKYAMSSEPKISVAGVDKIKVFTGLGTLVSLMECYYQKLHMQYKVNVTRFNGALYLERDFSTTTYEPRKETNGTLLQPKDTCDSQLRKNLFTESPYDEPNINEPYDANKGLLGVRKFNFGQYEIIYSGPIHGIHADNEVKDFEDMEELNNCRFVMVKQMWDYLRKNALKHLNYWLQAYLLNATDIYFAYKDSDGFVSKPIVHKSLSQLAKEFNSHWKPDICTNFLYKVLYNVNTLMTNDKINSLNTVYEFQIDLKNLTITYKIFKDNSEKIFVTPDDME